VEPGIFVAGTPVAGRPVVSTGGLDGKIAWQANRMSPVIVMKKNFFLGGIVELLILVVCKTQLNCTL
jgi:hypothetical protein